MLTQEQVQQKYDSLDYGYRYLCGNVQPSRMKQSGQVFAVETRAGLACDALQRPLLFETEAAAFAYRQDLGMNRPVLVFTEDALEPDHEDADDLLEPHVLDALTLRELNAYLGD